MTHGHHAPSRAANPGKGTTMNMQDVYHALWQLGINAADFAKQFVIAEKRAIRWRNKQHDGATEYQPVSYAGREFLNLRQMYEGFDA